NTPTPTPPTNTTTITTHAPSPPSCTCSAASDTATARGSRLSPLALLAVDQLRQLVGQEAVDLFEVAALVMPRGAAGGFEFGEEVVIVRVGWERADSGGVVSGSGCGCGCEKVIVVGRSSDNRGSSASAG